MGSNNGEKVARNFMDRFVEMHLPDEQIKDILAERAAVLATAPLEEGGSSATSQYVVFRLASERYCMAVTYVEEIQPMKPITVIPGTPMHIVGAVNIRGTILPIIDLRSFLGLGQTDPSDGSKLIVIRAEQLHVGIITDSVEEVFDVAAEEIGSQIATLSGAPEEFMKGVTNNSIIVIDIGALAKDKRLIVHEEA